MTDFLTSTQLSKWIYPSLDVFKEKVKKAQRKTAKKVEKLTYYQPQPPTSPLLGPAGMLPQHQQQSQHHLIVNQIQYVHQQKLLSYCVQSIIPICQKLNFQLRIYGTSMTYLRRFYIKQSIFEFDPVEMMFACIFLATKIEEVNLDLESFCQKVGQPNHCTPEKVSQNEVFLVRGLSFDLIVHTPFQLIDVLVLKIKEKVPYLDVQVMKKKILEQVIKVFQLDYLIFIYTPSHIGLACADIALNQLSESGQLESSQGDITSYFPDVSLAVWDKVGYIKEAIKKYNPPNTADVQKIRQQLKHFHTKHPEFLNAIADQRKKREAKSQLCGFESDKEQEGADSNNKEEVKKSKDPEQQIPNQPQNQMSQNLNNHHTEFETPEIPIRKRKGDQVSLEQRQDPTKFRKTNQQPEFPNKHQQAE